MLDHYIIILSTLSEVSGIPLGDIAKALNSRENTDVPLDWHDVLVACYLADAGFKIEDVFEAFGNMYDSLDFNQMLACVTESDLFFGFFDWLVWQFQTGAIKYSRGMMNDQVLDDGAVAVIFYFLSKKQRAHFNKYQLLIRNSLLEQGVVFDYE